MRAPRSYIKVGLCRFSVLYLPDDISRVWERTVYARDDRAAIEAAKAQRSVLGDRGPFVDSAFEVIESR